MVFGNVYENWILISLTPKNSWIGARYLLWFWRILFGGIEWRNCFPLEDRLRFDWFIESDFYRLHSFFYIPRVCLYIFLNPIFSALKFYLDFNTVTFVLRIAYQIYQCFSSFQALNSLPLAYLCYLWYSYFFRLFLNAFSLRMCSWGVF